MDVAYINPFIRATGHVFDTMIHVPVHLGKPFLRVEDDRLYKLCRISAAIGLSGSVRGLVVLSLSEPVALSLVSGLTGDTVKDLGNDCFDALAEIVNMIAGGAKKDFPGGQVTLTVPTLLRTEDVIYPTNHPIVVIPFDTGVGRFVIETSLSDPRDKKAA